MKSALYENRNKSVISGELLAWLGFGLFSDLPIWKRDVDQTTVNIYDN